MSDLIERQAAIDALDKRFDSIPMEQTAEILQLRKDLRELPSAQPERKRGKWILKPNIYGVVYCSECDYELHTNNTNFCPNCGAEMKEDVIHCKDCEWWTKQDKSLQGRCELMQMYLTGEWFCGNAQKRVTDGKNHR